LIAVLPGDGIGPEVTAVALQVLRRVRPDLECELGLVGGAALESSGTPYPDATRALVRRSSAILFGSVGDARFEKNPDGLRPESALLAIRKEFDLYANIRPVKMFPGLENASTLRAEVVRGLDLIVLRELTSGLYFGKPKGTTTDNGVEVATDTLTYTAPEIERIVRFGFELATKRRKKLTSVDKQNVLETGRLWRRIATRVASEYPDVALEHLLVDNAAMQLVRDPRRFDVIVTENTFGDILSDQAAMLTGSIGNLPSASIGTGSFGMYEPISGTAPDIAGKGIANPTAAILSAAMLCRYSLADEVSARAIESALEHALADGARTADLARPGETKLSTEAFGARVLDAIPATIGNISSTSR
jgi:3-isopropylmalate dehydrogenase